jgi:hypothetical protein
MLTREENELVSRVGARTPMGDLMRRYWIPATTASSLWTPFAQASSRRVLLVEAFASSGCGFGVQSIRAEDPRGPGRVALGRKPAGFRLTNKTLKTY